MREKFWIGPVVAPLAMALLGGCGGKVEDGNSSGAKIDGGGTLDGKVDEGFSGSQVEDGGSPGGKIEDGGSLGAKTYGALDVANGTCAPVVGKTFACGSPPIARRHLRVGNEAGCPRAPAGPHGRRQRGHVPVRRRRRHGPERLWPDRLRLPERG
jgi:hypothetical protein